MLFRSATLFFPAAAFADRSIYGADDRLDYFEAPAPMQRLADSVVSLWPSKQVKELNGSVMLATISFGDAMNLCPGEKFREQPIGAFCSGTLVGEDMILTAGHCILDEAQCADTKFVFGYNISKAGGSAPVTATKPSDVYGCKRIIKRDLDKQGSGIIGTGLAIIGALLNKAGPDFAVIQLDRKVTGRRPLELNRGGGVNKGDKVFVIGHPVGLPLKVTGGGQVRDNKPRSFFLTDLDTFGGNSGSAVFNASTNKIEGILVRGGTDFVDSPQGCKVQYKVGQNEGRGEAVTKADRFSKYVPSVRSAKSAFDLVDMSVEEVPAPSEQLSRQIRF